MTEVILLASYCQFLLPWPWASEVRSRTEQLCIRSHNLLLPHPSSFMDPYQKTAEAGSVSFWALRWSEPCPQLLPRSGIFQCLYHCSKSIASCIFQKVPWGHVFPCRRVTLLLLPSCVAQGALCFRDSWGLRLFQVVPFDLAVSWRAESSVSLPTCVCIQTVTERYHLQQMGPLVPSCCSGSIWGSGDPSEIPPEACCYWNRCDVRLSSGDVFKTDEADGPDGDLASSSYFLVA